ncbi:tectonic-3 [Orussus abietinus]|uniref:tectonic-3 n=1 Tax=Orussus abietinus TaxID=222816 RepID=UPI00062680EF|nr:tectonic-3 [Orussus abietinus]
MKMKTVGSIIFLLIDLSYYHVGCETAISNTTILTTDSFSQSTVQEFTMTTEDSNKTEIQEISMATETSKIAVTATMKPHQSPIINTAFNQTIQKVLRTKSTIIQRRQSEFCECDSKASSCDINCCCDPKCSEFHVAAFSSCTDRNAKVYDKRYCYDKNFIDYNNTKFLLERLTSNLFCIAYDNLPPAYSASNAVDVKNQNEFDNIVNGFVHKKFKWQWETVETPPQFNITEPYRDGDILWKLESNLIQPLYLLNTGFTAYCSFKKVIKYLRDWKGSCLQTELSNQNTFLFPSTFNNFSIIASPLLFNETSIISQNQTCPKNVCLPLVTHYCLDSWVFCNDTDNVIASCSNNRCRNIIQSVRFVIIHNGTMGIKNIDIYFKLGDVSDKFYQNFEVVYEWADKDRINTFDISGYPGYIIGKPIIIGTLITNKTSDEEIQFISVNKTNYIFTLPQAMRSGECDKINRYKVGFGEDIKLRCTINIKTNNFSTNSCIRIQNETLKMLLGQSLFNITEIGQYIIYVSKLGKISINDTASWTQIFLDRVPNNVVTGQIVQNHIRCSGLITSLRTDVLHSSIAKPENLNNHKILSIKITFSDEVDLFWSKCSGINCTDNLSIDVISYVMFYDMSQPTKFHFVGGPNLDINLPYDFFYPFLSRSNIAQPSIFLLLCILVQSYLFMSRI